MERVCGWQERRHFLSVSREISRISEELGDVPCLILVGGLGTRLQSILPDIPKPMAPVAGKPFLEYLIRWVRRVGFRRVILCVGYRADQIRAYFGKGDALGVQLTYSEEKEPLGTWGAIRQARELINDPQFLVLNGDSWVQVDLCQFLNFHHQKQGVASIAVVQVANSYRFGSIRLDASKRVTKFSEKQREDSTLINGGVYVFSREAFDAVPLTMVPCSLEKDIFPSLIPRGLYGMPVEGYFVDIGMPEEYNRLLCDAGRWIKALGIRGTDEGKC
jgi:D-glycero-alpha-D-manno-heptose 1-phosphate guanylyltransferase